MPEYANTKFELTIITDRIYRLKPYDGTELEVSDARIMRTEYLRYSGGKTFAVLLDATGNMAVTPEARELLASKEFTEKRIAAAFVVRGLANKLVGNFFIKVNRPASPTKLFSDEKTAIIWLQKQIALSDSSGKI